MDTLFYLANGAIYKYYDDAADNNSNISSEMMEALKVIVIAIHSMAYIKSPELALYFCFAVLECIRCGALDNAFWKAWGATPFLAVLLNYQYFLSLAPFDLFFHIIVYILFVGIQAIESSIFQEEISIRKYISRIVLFIGTAIGLIVANMYTQLNFVIPTLLFYIGYFGMNLYFHFPTIVNMIQKDTKQTE